HRWDSAVQSSLSPFPGQYRECETIREPLQTSCHVSLIKGRALYVARREVERSGETKNSNIKIVDNDAFSRLASLARLARLVENSA
ncbi:MAG: hypothetical protein P8X67_11680, partial [Syntrophobacterales bacterium]